MALISVICQEKTASRSRYADVEETALIYNLLLPLAARKTVVTQTNAEGVVPFESLGTVEGRQVDDAYAFA